VSGGICNPPWNAAWNGVCETCGHRFEVVCETRSDDARTRILSVEPAQQSWPVWVDYVIVFAGVRITVRDEGLTGKDVREQSLFLRMPELLRLVEALKDELKVCLFQYDWDEDST
jgi:hypothetical protein